MTVSSSTSAPHVASPAHDHVIHGTTRAQKVFILAVAVAVVAGTIFSLITLGIPQAIAVGGVLGLSTLFTLSEFFRVRMVKLSQIKTYKHSEWTIFPKGLFANANIVRRPRHHHQNTEHHAAPTLTVPSQETPVHHHRRRSGSVLTPPAEAK